MYGTPNPISKELGQRILEVKERIVANFTAEDWGELGLRTGYTDLINNHERLLRSLSWNDPDYAGHVQSVLLQIARHDLAALSQIEEFINHKYPDNTQFVSARPMVRRLTFAPNVFEIPENVRVEPDLAAVMMPFAAEFRPVHATIKIACENAGFRCVRGDDIWDHATVMQDVFGLLLRAGVVIVDFSGKNANVMYETGIAHTLGKLVVPIVQSVSDVPFDVKHHRVLQYLPNNEGLAALQGALQKKLTQMNPGQPKPPWA